MHFTIDYRQGMIEFRPFIYGIRFIELSDKEKPLLAKIFLDQNTAEKMRWIASYLSMINQSAEITYSNVENEQLDMIISMIAQGFPIIDFAKDFAKDFDSGRIIDKGVESMDIHVSSWASIQAIDESFSHWLNQPSPECNLSINSIDPQSRITLEEEIATIPASVSPLSLSS